MVAWSDDTQAAWELHAAELAKLPGVVSVSTGRRRRGGKETREQTVVVTVRQKLPPSQLGPSSLVPTELRLPDGKVVRTDVVEDPSAVFTADQDSAAYRPVPGGCEIGAFGSAFLGTLGGWFCARAARGSGWNTVWLTNAHVADPVNQSTIPADPRMTQPWGGAVIGNTMGISGWPNPLPGPGVTVGGVTDAAIGTLAAGVNADLQVLQIAPAPFEIGTVTAGLGVQKRGRTTRLRNGTVQTQPGGGPFLAANVTSPAGGHVGGQERAASRLGLDGAVPESRRPASLLDAQAGGHRADLERRRGDLQHLEVGVDARRERADRGVGDATHGHAGAGQRAGPPADARRVPDHPAAPRLRHPRIGRDRGLVHRVRDVRVRQPDGAPAATARCARTEPAPEGAEKGRAERPDLAAARYRSVGGAVLVRGEDGRGILDDVRAHDLAVRK